mmetsp:Transcript_18396/g.25851  ORF Transcript_18396/g.25851 Transcript_18396/m.25851 type:complete len:242 (+) Transcript_18396:792-1517(+)
MTRSLCSSMLHWRMKEEEALQPMGGGVEGIEHARSRERGDGAGDGSNISSHEEEDASESETLGVDAVIYNTAIHVCVQNKAVKQAIRLLADMQRELLQPDHYTFTSLIKGSGSIGKWELSLALFEDYKRRLSSFKNSNNQKPLSRDSFERRHRQRSTRMVYFAVMDALWGQLQKRGEGGSEESRASAATLESCQKHADNIFLEMRRERLVNARIESLEGFTSIDFHTLSSPVARSATRWCV